MSKPKDYDEFVRIYEPMARRILQFKYNFRNDALDDMVQMIMLEFIQGNYLEIYDESKSELSSFLLAFIYLRVKREWTKKKRDALTSAMRIVEDFDEEGGCSILETECPDFTYEMVNAEMDSRMKEQVFYCREVLAEIPPNGEVAGETGVHQRSLLAVFDMLMLGYDRKQIASSLRYSKATVSNMIAKLRGMPCIKVLKDMLEEKNFATISN